MTRLSLQFHAAPDEIPRLVGVLAAAHGLRVAVERFFPTTQCIATSADGIAAAIQELGGECDRFWLCAEPLTVDASKDPPLAGRPECMAVSVGRLTPEGLRESAIGAVSDNRDAVRTWRGVLKDAKKQMSKGAWAVNPASGARVVVPDHFYTDGARALSASGTKMLAAAGWNCFEFEETGAL
jgi:hypothetical protein